MWFQYEICVYAPNLKIFSGTRRTNSLINIETVLFGGYLLFEHMNHVITKTFQNLGKSKLAIDNHGKSDKYVSEVKSSIPSTQFYVPSISCYFQICKLRIF